MKRVLTRYHRIGLWSVMTGSKVNCKLFASSLYPASSLLHRIFYLSNIPIDFFPFRSHRIQGEQSPESPVDDVVPFHVGSEEPSWRVMFDEVGFAFGVRRIRWVGVTPPTHCQYKIESFQLISPFPIYGVLRNKPDGSELFAFDDACSEVYDTGGCDSPES